MTTYVEIDKTFDAEDITMTLHVNGVAHKVTIEPRVTLLDALRERIGLTGTKKGCDHGQCGCCTVLINGTHVDSCLTLAIMHEDDEIATIEGLAQHGLHPMQEAFVKHDGYQCGYCTSGQIMSVIGMLSEGYPDSDEEIRMNMTGNLCRCSAYVNIVAAIQEVADAQKVADK
jgi:xanthine dehydrogenase YagT iron-sulfur-binding subunit